MHVRARSWSAMSAVASDAVLEDFIRQGWDETARSWRLRLVLHSVRTASGWTDQWHLACAGYANTEPNSDAWGGCGALLLMVHDGAASLLVNPGQQIRLLLSHLKEHHAAVGAVVTANARARAGRITLCQT